MKVYVRRGEHFNFRSNEYRLARKFFPLLNRHPFTVRARSCQVLAYLHIFLGQHIFHPRRDVLSSDQGTRHSEIWKSAPLFHFCSSALTPDYLLLVVSPSPNLVRRLGNISREAARPFPPIKTDEGEGALRRCIVPSSFSLSVAALHQSPQTLLCNILFCMSVCSGGIL